MSATVPPVLQEGRDYWRPHAELQAQRERIDALEARVEFLEDENGELSKALTLALRYGQDFLDRIRALEAALAGKGGAA